MSREKRTALIVDDEDALRENLEYFFEDKDWQTLTAVFLFII